MAKEFKKQLRKTKDKLIHAAKDLEPHIGAAIDSCQAEYLKEARKQILEASTTLTDAINYQTADHN